MFDARGLRASWSLLRRNVPHPNSSDRPVRAQFGFMAADSSVTFDADSNDKYATYHVGVVLTVFAELFPGVPLTGFGAYDLF